MSDAIRVALIDDDAAVLDSLRLYLLHQNLDTSCFSSAEDFLVFRLAGTKDHHARAGFDDGVGRLGDDIRALLTRKSLHNTDQRPIHYFQRQPNQPELPARF